MNFKMKIWSRHIAQNMNEKNWKILPWTLFCSYFRQWDDTIFSFWNFLTFTCSNGVNFCHILIRVHSSVSKGRDVPRDVPGQTGTGRPIVPLSRDKKNSLSRCPFVPGQKSFACPAVPLSRDKGRSKCPGTNSSVPGRPGTKWILRNSEKKNRYPVLEHHFPVLEHLFLF